MANSDKRFIYETDEGGIAIVVPADDNGLTLDEIKEFLKDDPELSDEERFELYYDEREKRKERKNSLSYEQLLKKSGVKPPSAKK